MEQNEESRAAIARKPGNEKPVVMGKTYLLGIAIDAYWEYKKLHNTKNDWALFKQSLKDNYHLDNGDICELIDSNATKFKILKTLENYSKEGSLSKLREEDRLIIYFAGHGYIDEHDYGYWIPVDAKKNFEPQDFIPNTEIRDCIRKMSCRHILLISDSCFSGSLFELPTSREGNDSTTRDDSDLEPDATELQKLRWLIASGKKDQKVPDGIEGGNSPFARSMADCLKNTPTKISIVALGEHVIDDLMKKRRSNKDPIPQSGHIKDVGHDYGRFILRKKMLVTYPSPEFSRFRHATDKEMSLILGIGAWVLAIVLRFIVGFPDVQTSKIDVDKNATLTVDTSKNPVPHINNEEPQFLNKKPPKTKIDNTVILPESTMQKGDTLILSGADGKFIFLEKNYTLGSKYNVGDKLLECYYKWDDNTRIYKCYESDFLRKLALFLKKYAQHRIKVEVVVNCKCPTNIEVLDVLKESEKRFEDIKSDLEKTYGFTNIIHNKSEGIVTNEESLYFRLTK